MPVCNKPSLCVLASAVNDLEEDLLLPPAISCFLFWGFLFFPHHVLQTVLSLPALRSHEFELSEGSNDSWMGVGRFVSKSNNIRMPKV